jgi:hypothetical protein
MVDSLTAGMYQAKGLRTALRLGEPMRLFRIVILYAIFLGAQGARNARRGARLVEWGASLVGETDAFHRAYLGTAHGMFAYFRGEFEQAGVVLDETSRLYAEETAGTMAELNTARTLRCQALRFQGRFTTLREHYDEHMRDARHRGDQYLKSTLQRSLNQLWLAEDDPDGARESLAAAAWSPPEHKYHLQHWYELRAIAERGLYTGEIDHDALRAPMDALRESRLTRVQTVRAEAAWLRMRLALAGGTAWDARREVAALEGERIGFASVWAGLGRAALATGAARDAALDAVIRDADQLAMHGCAAAARWRRGDVDAARTLFAKHGVVRPERMVEVLAPGFP